MSRTETASSPYLANRRSPAVMSLALVRSPAAFPSERTTPRVAPPATAVNVAVPCLTSMADLITILDPRVRPADDKGSPTFDVATTLHGVTVGLRLDHSWRSYMTVVEEWERMLQADGATVRVLWTG